MKIERVKAVTGPRLERAWRLYSDVFDELRYLAVQRHVLHRDEFDAVMADERVGKHLALDGEGGLRGLSTHTNDLRAVPLISPEYFQRRWPAHYEQGRIWYCGLVAVLPGTENAGVFAGLIESMYRVTEANDGIVAIDLCRYNDEILRMSRAVRLLLQRFSGGVRETRLDHQAYWIYEFPTT